MPTQTPKSCDWGSVSIALRGVRDPILLLFQGEGGKDLKITADKTEVSSHDQPEFLVRFFQVLIYHVQVAVFSLEKLVGSCVLQDLGH